MSKSHDIPFQRDLVARLWHACGTLMERLWHVNGTPVASMWHVRGTLDPYERMLDNARTLTRETHMILTSLDGLIKAKLLVLDDKDDTFSMYLVAEGTVLLDEDSKIINFVQVLHDDNDRVLIFVEGNTNNPQNIERDDALRVRLFTEIGKGIDGGTL